MNNTFQNRLWFTFVCIFQYIHDIFCWIWWIITGEDITAPFKRYKSNLIKKMFITDEKEK